MADYCVYHSRSYHFFSTRPGYDSSSHRWLVDSFSVKFFISPHYVNRASSFFLRFIIKPYQRDRILTFVNPYSDPLDRGYQVIQSVITVGSGQFWGRGLGQGTQSQLRFLPERHTDFIFASLSEELGFVGAAFTLILFLIIMWRIYLLSQYATNPVVTLYALGTLTMLSFQIWVNIGMNLGLAPITGITLPFVSYGGSSLVSLGLTLGILTSMNRQTSPSSFQIK